MQFNRRLEIDGLRGLSIIFVILFHLEIPGFEGGFIGVDIFFVISGFLITNIILNQILNKNFNLYNFYENRARRILPNLIVMILFSSFLSFLLLSPKELLDFANSNLSAIFFYSNFFFKKLDYFDLESKFIPNFHIWSLSFEEQFYIIFPLFLIIFFKRKYFNFILIFILLISFIFSEFLNHIIPIKYSSTSINNVIQYGNFLLPYGRIWEFLIGSLISLKFKKLKFENTCLKNLFLNLSLGLIFYSVFFFDKETSYPSIFTLLPVIGTCLIIINFDIRNWICKFLINKFLAFIGLFSYSLYLWHYPIISYWKRFNLKDNYINKLFLILLIIFISYFFFKFIENPFRNKKIIFKKKFYFFLFSSLSVIFILVFIIKITNGLEFRYNNLLKSYPEVFIKDRLNINTCGPCGSENRFSYLNDKKKILIIGDSHASNLYMSIHLNKNLLLKDIEVAYYNIKPNNFYYQNIKNKLLVDEFFNSEKYKQSNLIIFISNYEKLLIDENKNIIQELNKLILMNKYLDKKKELIIFGNLPKFKTVNAPVEEILYRQNSFILNQKVHILTKQEIENLAYFSLENDIFIKNNLLNKISSNLQIKYISTLDFFCKKQNNNCKVFTDENITIFSDSRGHLTYEGGIYFGKFVIDKINTYFK